MHFINNTASEFVGKWLQVLRANLCSIRLFRLGIESMYRG